MSENPRQSLAAFYRRQRSPTPPPTVPERAPARRRYRLSDVRDPDSVKTTAPVRPVPVHQVQDQFDQLAERVLNTNLTPESSYWRQILRRMPTGPELAWLCGWRLTSHANWMLVGYLKIQDHDPASVRFIVYGDFSRTSWHVATHIPAGAKEPQSRGKNVHYPNPAEAILAVQREVSQPGVSFTVERPGKLLEMATETVEKAVRAQREVERIQTREFPTRQRGFDL